MIISASRRTDIPAFYAEWFMQRVRAGYCTVPNPFNANQVSNISLAPADVGAIVFWTRNPRPLMSHLHELDEQGYRYVFQYTLLDYPRWLETHTPPVDAAVAAFRELADRIGPERVIWRYDPLVFTRSLDAAYHRRTFNAIASALAGYTHRVVISIVDEYAKTRRRLGQLADEAPVAKETLSQDDTFAELMRDLAAMTGEHGMEPQSCAETVNLQPYGIRPGKCIDDDLLRGLFGLDITDTKDPSQRTHCGCVVSKDIGMYNSCLFGCQYCYATGSFNAARTRHEQHDPHTSSLFVAKSSKTA